MILESMDFGGKGGWWCVEGGASQVAQKMRDQIKLRNPNAFQWGQLVTEIGYTPGSNQTKIDVTWQDDKIGVPTQTKTYDAVFNSATLGSMKYMKLENLNLNWGSKQAIRNLGYGASCKVGVRFKTLWWMENGLNITSGGVAKSDLPIQFCVYPSYNINDDRTQPGVLLVSYTWAREAERLGALINRESPLGEARLRALITHNLALLHAKTGDKADYDRLLGIINDNWLDHHAYNWYENPRMAGAFAFFGPGQFTHLYNDIIASDGRYMMIGEATSAHHAWVLGALESAVRGVYQFLYTAQKDPNAVPAQNAYKGYNENDIPGPYGPLPVEMNLPSHVKIPEDAPEGLAEEVNRRGELTRIGVLLEQIRLKYDLDEFDPEKATKDDLAPFWDLLPDDFEVKA
jgi:monoamine oxidase